ncbi:MAG: hypothetical protein J5J00_15105, partial [Deltaproteobacteria bacterium]|nr:hypothetical protein [Deltaproteobacteria bacterium]
MSDNAITDARETSRKDSVFSFISDVKRVFPAEFLNASVRATPHGLFVEESSLGRIIEGYQSWLAQATAGEVVKSPGKCMKRLFGSTEPVRQYLIEGKQCLIGMLIKSEIAHAQSLGLPYFLGSLTSMREFIHPRDPIFSSLKNIEVVNTSQGSVYRLSSAGPNYDVPEERLRSFASIAARSSIILRQEPKLPESLAAALRALISMLEKSRAAGGDKEILVPSRFSDQERYNFKILGSFTFVFDRNNTLQHCYDLRSSNLFRFIREEFKHFGHQRTIG